jgi:hypothetical protein
VTNGLPAPINVSVQLDDQAPIVSLELHPNLSGPEMLFAVEDTFKLIHQGFGKHRLKHFLADGTSAWISPIKSLTNQLPAITEGHLLVLVVNGEVRYHLGAEDATVFKLDEFGYPSNLGSGAFGEVGLFRHKGTGENVAIKTITNWDITTRAYTDLVREVTILRDAHQPSVLGVPVLDTTAATPRSCETRRAKVTAESERTARPRAVRPSRHTQSYPDNVPKSCFRWSAR